MSIVIRGGGVGLREEAREETRDFVAGVDDREEDGERCAASWVSKVVARVSTVVLRVSVDSWRLEAREVSGVLESCVALGGSWVMGGLGGNKSVKDLFNSASACWVDEVDGVEVTGGSLGLGVTR